MRSRTTAALAAAALLAGGIAASTSTPGAGADSEYDANLALIRSQSWRNANHDASSDRDTPQADLVLEDHLGPRTGYLGNPGGHPEGSFPVDEGGQFRVSCEFSHFAYDDPIVTPGQPGASHLHMFWGNTDVNAHSTYESLRDSGSSTCNGQELNRTGYWAPALFDAEGNVRIPERIGIYYKGYGLARGASQEYPPGAAMVAMRNIHEVSWNEGGTADPNGASDVTFNCASQWRGDRDPAGSTIPTCDGSRYFDEYGVEDEPHVILEQHVKFPNCWNGEDPSVPSNWRLARVGSWFYSECESDPTFPNIEYIIQYKVEIGETTDGWFLASDVDSETLQMKGPGGATSHADWWGGWHPEINRTWLDNCTNFATDQPSGCGHGYLSDGGPDGDNPLPGQALKFRPQFDGPNKVSSAALAAELCPGSTRSGQQAAHCVAAATPPTTSAPAPTTTVPIEPMCDGRPATIVGTNGDDLIRGTRGNDVIVAGAGDDAVEAGRGNDVVCGGDGDDMIVGDGGGDRLFGGSGDDVVLGGSGNDTLIGDAGNDRLQDIVGRNTIEGGAGDDRCTSRRGRSRVDCDVETWSTAASPVIN